MTPADTVLRYLGVDDFGATRTAAGKLTAPIFLRLFYLCYLIDWKSSLERGKRLSNFTWRRANWGPYSPELLSAIVPALNRRALPASDLPAGDKEIVGSILLKWGNVEIDTLRNIANSTYPLIVSEHDSVLDLERLAGQYRKDFKPAQKISA